MEVAPTPPSSKLTGQLLLKTREMQAGVCTLKPTIKEASKEKSIAKRPAANSPFSTLHPKKTRKGDESKLRKHHSNVGKIGSVQYTVRVPSSPTKLGL